MAYDDTFNGLFEDTENLGRNYCITPFKDTNHAVVQLPVRDEQEEHEIPQMGDATYWGLTMEGPL